MFRIVCLVFAVLSTYISIADNGQISTGVSVGVVDMQRIILSVDEGKKARADLEKKIKAKQDDLQLKKKDLDKLNNEWKSQSQLLSEDARARKQKEFQDKVMELRNIEMAFESEVKKEESTATQRIAMKAAKMAEMIAKEKNYDMVFEANSSGLIYVKNPVDLTEQIIKGYDKFPSQSSKPSDAK